MFIVEWDCPDYSDHNVSIFSDEFTARREICAQILNSIRNLVLHNDGHLNDAKKINDLIAEGTLESYRSAIRTWNDSALNMDHKPEFWACYSEHVRDEAETPEILTNEFFLGHMIQDIIDSATV